MKRLVQSVFLLCTAVVLAAPALGQGFDIRSLFNWGPATTGTVPPTAAAPNVGPDWSGESGASGHPLMTAEAIRAAAANFRQCLAELWPLAERRGISRDVYE